MDRAQFLKDFEDHVYQGEVFGEALFNAWLSKESDEDKRYKLANLVQLETEMKARLRPLALKLGLDLAQRDMREKVDAALNGYSSMPWVQVMAKLRDGTAWYLERFKALADAAADSHEAETMRIMVTHEVALNKFALLELAGSTENSIDEVVGQLLFPIPRPTK